MIPPQGSLSMNASEKVKQLNKDIFNSLKKLHIRSFVRKKRIRTLFAEFVHSAAQALAAQAGHDPIAEPFAWKLYINQINWEDYENWLLIHS